MHTSPNFQFSDIEAGGVEGGQQGGVEGRQQETKTSGRHGKGFVFFSNDFKQSTKLNTEHNNQN